MCRDTHDYHCMSTTNLINEAQFMLAGTTTRTPEVELALALLERVEALEQEGNYRNNYDTHDA